MNFSFCIEKHPQNDLRGPLLKNEFTMSDYSAELINRGTENTIKFSTLITVSGIEDEAFSDLQEDLKHDGSLMLSDPPNRNDASVILLSLRRGTFDETADAVLKLLLIRHPELSAHARVSSAQCYTVYGVDKKTAAKHLKEFLLSGGELCEYPEDISDDTAEDTRGTRKKIISDSENPDLSEPFLNSVADSAVKKYLRTSQEAMAKCNLLFTKSGNETEFSATAYEDIRDRLRELDLTMEEDDAHAAQDYFVSESREATEMELRIINKFRSERCTHPSLYTVIDNPIIADPDVKDAYSEYLEIAKNNTETEDVSTVSDIAQAAPLQPDAYSDGIALGLVNIDPHRKGIRFNTDSGEKILAFDHESNNARTSIDPTGGASACLGDAMRKLLRVFAEPYDTFRISGIADPTQDPVTPEDEAVSTQSKRYEPPAHSAAMQRALARNSCDSFASYARDAGVPCSLNAEYVSENYRDKHMEVSAALALLDASLLTPNTNDGTFDAASNDGTTASTATQASDTQHSANDNDSDEEFIVLIGSRTGRDGKIYNSYLKEQTKELSADLKKPLVYDFADTENRQNIDSEQAREQITKIETRAAGRGIQLYGEPIPGGNGALQKKLICLFKDPEFHKLVNKLHDIDTNGIVIAASALSDGITLYLDCVPLKYPGMTATEVAFSETCERFLATANKQNIAELAKLCKQYGLLCATIGTVTNDKKLTVYGGGKLLASLETDFLRNGSSDKIIGANVKAPLPLKESESLNIAELPLESISPLKRIFSKVRPDFTGAYKRVAELSRLKNRVRSRRFDNTLSGSSVLSPMGKGKCSAAISLIRDKDKQLTLNSEKLCSAVTVGLFPDICSADPYKGAYFAVTAALARLVAAGFSNKGAHIAIHQFYPSYKKDSEHMGNVFAAILGTFNAQNKLKTKSICGDFSLGGIQSSDTAPSTAVFGIALGKESNAVSSELKASGNKLVILQPSLGKTGVPDPEEQLEVFETVTSLLSAGAVSAISVTGISAAEAIMHMGLEAERSLGFEFSSECSAKDIFDTRYGAIIVEVPQGLELPKNAFVLGTVTNEPIVTDGEAAISLSELEKLCYENEEKVYENSPCDEVQEELDKYLELSFDTLVAPIIAEETEAETAPDVTAQAESQPEQAPENSAELRETATDNVIPNASSGSVSKNTAANVAKKNILIANFRGTHGSELISDVFNKLSQQYPIDVKILDLSFDYASVRAFAKEIRACDALCIPDGADHPAVIATILRKNEVAKAIAELRKRGGLVYGSGSGFSALIIAGLLGSDIPEAEDQEKKKEFAVTLADCPLSGLTRKTVLLRALPSESPFTCCFSSEKVYSSEISAYRGRLMAEPAMLMRASANKMIPTVYCDTNGMPSNSQEFSPCASMFGIDALTSLDGTVCGQISFPERMTDSNSKFEPLPIFESIAKYLSEKMPERSKT